jgi:hypothetical protein
MSAVLVIAGVTIDRVATRTTLLHCRPYAKDGVPTLSFARAIGALASGPDPWDAQTVTLTQDSVLIFAGDTGTHLTHYDRQLGWVREWTCYGLAKRAEYIPVTNSIDLSDRIRFNTAADDPDDIPSNDGRTIGEIAAEVLEMPQNAAALTAAGLVNYTSAGTGAAATCTVSGGVVQSTFVVTAGGTGYTTAPTVLLSGGGGSGATATATVSGGAVTGITRTAGGSGYLSPPVVILSRLPAVTLSDLDALTVIPPFEVDVAGERILQALEGVVQSCHPNHFVQVDPSGNVRFLDPRTFASDITLTMDDPSDPRVGKPSITSDWSGCYTAVNVRGHDLVQAVTLGLAPWPGSSLPDGGLAEDFAHDGLTNSQAKANYQVTDFTQPGLSPGTATATATVTSSAVSAVTVGQGGYGYSAAPTVSFSGGGGSGATATANLTSGVVSSITVTGGGSSYTSAPTVTLTGPAVGQSDVGTCTCPSTTTIRVTSTNTHAIWGANYWDQTVSGHHGVIVAQNDAATDYTIKWQARITANTALTAGGTSDLTIDNPLPTTAYTSYQIYGTAGGASVVYRRYSVTNADIAGRLANYFPYPQAVRNSSGAAATLTSTPVGTVFYEPSGLAAEVEQSGIGIAVDPVSGTVLTAKPTCLVFSPDGVTITPVNDLQCVLPVYVGGLTVRSPSSSFAGTAYTSLGVQRLKTITCDSWRDHSNAANMSLMAAEFLDALKDVVLEGSIPYFGLLSSALLIGHKLTIAGHSYSVPSDWSGLPIVAVDLEYCERSGATSFVTTLSFSTRRAPYSGASLQRPAMTGQSFGGSVGSFGQSLANTMQGASEGAMMAADPSLAGMQRGVDQSAMGSIDSARATAGQNGPLDVSGLQNSSFGSMDSAQQALASNTFAAQGVPTSVAQALGGGGGGSE